METYYWNTEHPHFSNAQTMSEYLAEYLPFEFTIVYQDDSLAEIRNSETWERFEANASGNGDSFNHMIEFKIKQR